MGVNFGRLPRPTDGGTTPVIHVKDVDEGVLMPLEDLELISLPDDAQYERQRLKFGDILVSARGTLMKCATIPHSYRGAVASANFIVVRMGNRPAVEAELVCAFLRHPAVKAKVLSRVTSTAQPALTIRELENLIIPLPSKEIRADLTQLLIIAEEQYRTAVECARLRKEEAMDILAKYMDPFYEA
ncbi:restriction endonuclease subunit S [Rhizobium brockwellii]|nr:MULTISPECIES: restriction endonuclease subunit S [Rhizobium]MDV4181503.1 restriction endonuclease subunit S [Rhizobium brockwellii]